MPHYTPLITTIVAALTLAWVFAAVAHRFKLPPLVGYLLAGIVIGPFTPGYVADQNLAGQLAEIGVILLMFGVGLHFSLEDLLSGKKIAIPGAIVQIACATLLGMGLAAWLGWPIGEGLVFGLALSVASTVVLLRVRVVCWSPFPMPSKAVRWCSNPHSQSWPSHHRPRAFRGRNPAPHEARRQSRGDGRARDRRRHGKSRHLKEHAANEARSVQA
jgi:hypothetical protein